VKIQIASLVLNGIFILAGALALTASICGWKWFFNTASARSVTGRNLRTARFLYGAAGLLILLAGIYGLSLEMH